jgi:PIN domain nuclease of toxin-antitoxin system
VTDRYLVDTNIVLWAWHEPHRVPRRLLGILSSDAPLYVSVATIWEISIKAGIGKLVTVDNVTDALVRTGYTLLPIKAEHVEAVRHLPFHHREPFDRLLVVQARIEGMRLMTSDRTLGLYGVALA